MTNNKAIEILNALAWVQGGPDREEIITAISMAIEALSTETKTKCIAQIKVDTEEIVRRIKEEYDIWIPSQLYEGDENK